MPKQVELVPHFVDIIPEDIEEGILYVSMKYATATHRCACGCREITVTPLNPDGWEITLSAENKVTLTPSIGNFQIDCRSHYWITENKIVWL